MENKYLDNNRVVSGETGWIEDTNRYFPFGGLMGDSYASDTHPYKYIGKELNRTRGLDWCDHGTRYYAPWQEVGA